MRKIEITEMGPLDGWPTIVASLLSVIVCAYMSTITYVAVALILAQLSIYVTTGGYLLIIGKFNQFIEDLMRNRYKVIYEINSIAAFIMNWTPYVVCAVATRYLNAPMGVLVAWIILGIEDLIHSRMKQLYSKNHTDV